MMLKEDYEERCPPGADVGAREGAPDRCNRAGGQANFFSGLLDEVFKKLTQNNSFV
jgi:hypothetical protein